MTLQKKWHLPLRKTRKRIMLRFFLIIRELKDSILKLNTDIENAYMGIAPKITSKIPDFLTPEKTLKILQRLLEEGRNNFWKEFYALRRDKSFWASKEPIPPGLYGNFRTYLRLSDKK